MRSKITQSVKDQLHITEIMHDCLESIDNNIAGKFLYTYSNSNQSECYLNKASEWGKELPPYLRIHNRSIYYANQ